MAFGVGVSWLFQDALEWRREPLRAFLGVSEGVASRAVRGTDSECKGRGASPCL